MQKESPYKYYNNELGFRVKYLTKDRCHKNSLKLISSRAFRKRMASKTCIEIQIRNGSLGVDSLVRFNSLSLNYKNKIIKAFGEPKEKVRDSWFSLHYEYDTKAHNFYLGHRYGKKNEHSLDNEKIELYTHQASVLNAVLKVKTNRKAYAKALGGVKIDIWDSLSRDVNAFRLVDHDLPKTPDTLRYKVTKYQKQGLKGLISGKLKNRNARKVKKAIQYAVIDKLLTKHTNLDNTLIANVYNSLAEMEGWKTITSATVGNRKKESNLKTYAGRNGLKKLENDMLMQVKRKRPSAPMLYWTLDGWDIELYYQKTEANAKGNKVTTYTNRLTVVAVLDPYNNNIIGYAIDTHETATLIKKALRNAMQNVKEMFGEFYFPVQIQSDNYGRGTLKEFYETISKHYTPAKVGNAKSKVIEPYFKHHFQKACQLHDNWSGYGVASGSKNQPNQEYLDKIKKSFPTKDECEKQFEAIIASKVKKLKADYIKGWFKTSDAHKQILHQHNYYLTFGETTGYTNKLRGAGLIATIDGKKISYDSFDVDFRKNSHKDWQLHYDTNDLTEVLAVSTDGRYRFVLEQKYEQPMALADRIEGDAEQLQKVFDYNKKLKDSIIDELATDAEIIENYGFDKAKLEGTLAGMLITDSQGQHKNQKSSKRLAASNAIAKTAKKTKKQEAKQERKEELSFADQQTAYYKDKISNLDNYLNQ